MLRVRLGVDDFECPSFASAQRLAGWFREELHEVRFTCMRCQRTAALPASYADRLPPEFRLFDASAPDAKLADPWHSIDSSSWPYPRWFCDECFWRHAVTLIPLPRK